MKFLCIDCDAQMVFEDRQQPGDGTFAAAFRCPTCGRRMALLANPMESQLVGSLGVKIGGRELDEQPFEMTRAKMVGKPDAFDDTESTETATAQKPGPVVWSPQAEERLARAPAFVRGMIKRIYAEYARERGIAEITPEVMDSARTDLGLEDM